MFRNQLLPVLLLVAPGVALAQPIPPPQPQPQFDTAVLDHAEDEYLGAYRFHRTIRVQWNGEAAVQRSHPLALIVPINGRATDAEMAALRTAVREARMSSLPDPLDAPLPMDIPLREIVVEVTSATVLQNNGRTTAQRGFYGQYDARLRPLVAALDAIGNRLFDEAEGSVFTGTVRTSGSTVRLEVAGDSYRLQPANMARELAQFRGKEVRLRGKLEAQGRLEVRRVLSPKQDQLTGTVRLDGNQLVLDLPAPFWGPPTIPAKVSGPAASLLRFALGKQVQVDGYAFADEGIVTVIEEVHVLSVKGKARWASTLRRGFSTTGHLKQGEEVDVIARGSGYVLVRSAEDGQEGWVRTNRIEIGATIFTTMPVTGLTSAVDGN